METAEIIDYCRGQIADYKVPRHVEIVDDFPRTSTNKIQRYILQKDVAVRFVGSAITIKLLSPEVASWQIWREVQDNSLLPSLLIKQK